jgi:phage tail sheath protein FI
MPELLRPDVYLEELPGVSIAPSVSVSTAGFVGVAERGPVNEATLITSWSAFETTFGSFVSTSYLANSVQAFFQEGGTRCYVVRITGSSGTAQASVDLSDFGGVAVGGAVTSGASAPFNLEPGETLTANIDGVGPDTATFSATRSTLAGSGGTFSTMASETFEVRIDGGDWQTITFTTEATIGDAVNTINAQLLGGYAAENTGQVDITSDTRGTDSLVETQNVAAGVTSKLGIQDAATSTAGTGNVANIDAVSASEFITIVEAAFTSGGGVSVSGSGLMTITSVTTGASGSIEITGGTANTTLLYDTSVYSGSASGQETAVTVQAKYVGSSYNLLKAYTQVASTTMSEVGGITGSVSSITVISPGNFSKGDVIWISDGSNSAVAVVNSVNLSAGTITFAAAITVTGTIANGATVSTSSQHRMSTQLSADLTSGSVSTAQVVSATNARVGQFITIADGTTLLEVEITGVNGNELQFGATALATTISASSSVVASQEFRLDIYDSGTFSERFEYLSMSENNAQDFVDTRLSGDDSEASLVDVTVNASPTNPTEYKRAPYPVTEQSLTGGADGTTAADSDYIGAAGASPTGLYAFDLLSDVNFIAVPGVATATTQGALVDYCENRGDCVGIVDPPVAKDEAQEIRDWRLNDLNKDSSYGALYYPWLKKVDPINSGLFVNVPPSGNMAGIWSNVSAVSGPQTPPANIALSNVVGLTHDTTDGEHDILNPIGVNVIRAYPGQGIRVMGSRTLQSAQDGKHYINVRRVINYVKVSLKSALRPYLQAAIDEDLWAQIRTTCDTFLTNAWRDGLLVPRTDKSQAYFVKVDEENNPASVQNAGRVNVAVGINPPRPAEFIVITLSLIDTVTATETTG